ncbi:MAG TPA: glucose dehydrogenase, partial [Planctomycetaceae bacterium]|nr:glucose dehydrogenase [Planctomycetaceae bacterium]
GEKVHPWKRDNEEGLLGLAFHPDYKKNGQFFVYYSSEKELRTSVVSKFTVSDDPDKADPKEEVIMKLKQPFANHNGGSICFGKDGYLYIALGDGGSRNDPMKNGQNLGTLLGSMLRIDVDSKADGKNYGIPADNPFVKVKDAQPEIFAYGFRNIWRMSVDRQTGDVWAADVGQDFWEEVNVVTKGGNYGWSVQEASFLFNNVAGEGELIDPVWEYDHQAGKSITGGYVYRGSRLPELAGNYLYADFISGQIWALEYDRASGKASKNRSIATTGFPVLAFGEDQDGEVYYTMETVTGKGIYKFVRK